MNTNNTNNRLSLSNDNKPPKWIPRFLIYSLLTVFFGLFIWHWFGQLSFIWTIIVITIFLQLAFEPLVVFMEKHKINRKVASALCLVLLTILLLLFLGLFGSLFVSQTISFVNSVPDTYIRIASFVKDNFGLVLPDLNSAGKTLFSNWGQDIFDITVLIGKSFTLFLFGFLTITVLFYYFSAYNKEFIHTVSKVLPKNKRHIVQTVWDIVQDKIAMFLLSRLILAIGHTICASIVLMLLHSPYWLPLAIFTGLLSQFIPVVGVYIAAVFPAVLLWVGQGLQAAIIFVICITVYQQLEHFILNPKLSSVTLSVNPAVALLMVLVLGTLFGALGAFFALPIVAVVQTILQQYFITDES